MEKSGLRAKGAERRLAESLSGGVAFLRHRVKGLEHRESSDWDVAVADSRRAGWAAEKQFGPPMLRVERQYVIQRYFDWGQLDFLPVFEWNGFEYLSSERFWSRVRTGDDGLPRPCIAHDALIAWLTGLLWGRLHQVRYEGLIERALGEEEVEFLSALEVVFGARLANELVGRVRRRDYRGVENLPLRRALMFGHILSNAGGALCRVGTHWQYEFHHHLKPPFPWVAFLGPDGSGKSTAIEGLCERLAWSRIGIRESRWWPEPLGKDEVPGPPVTDPHARAPRGTLLSILKTVWLGLRWWKERLGRSGHLRAKKSMLISDRYYDDLLVDPRRYRYGASRSWAAWMFGLLPRPDLVLVLAGQPEAIFERKKEVAFVELERQVAEYRRLVKEGGASVVEVDAAASVEEVGEEVWRQFTCNLRDRVGPRSIKEE